MRHWIAVSVLASLVVPATSYAALKAGHYDLGLQQICLSADKTWYGTSFPGWGGGWHSGKTGSSIYGNYAAGVGNDAIVLGPENTGIWEEWRDDGTWENLIRDITVTYIGDTCPPPVTSSATKVDPASR